MILTAKKILLAGPTALAPQVVGVTIPEAEALLKEWLHEALSQLYEDPMGEAAQAKPAEPSNPEK